MNIVNQVNGAIGSQDEGKNIGATINKKINMVFNFKILYIFYFFAIVLVTGNLLM